MWGRDDEFDRFLEQKIKEELAILVKGIPANSIRLYIMRKVKWVGALLRGHFYSIQRDQVSAPQAQQGVSGVHPENLSPFRRKEQLELQKVLLSLGNGCCSSCVQSFLILGYRYTRPAGGGLSLGIEVRHRDWTPLRFLFYITAAWPGLTLGL